MTRIQLKKDLADFNIDEKFLVPSKICTYQLLSARVDDKQAGGNRRQSRPEKLPRHEYLDATPSRQDVQQEAHGSGGEARE